ncbi:hypothetical protein [Pseudomonas jessenii]|uniref:hypothetical protein n=1 Tax=Pseudomonas jessenii TaxID=77298 RepID=UPI003891C1CA
MNAVSFVAGVFFAAVLSDVAFAVDAVDLNATEESDGYPCWQWEHHPPEYVMVKNTCGVPIEIQYCYFDGPSFTAGDLNKTCMSEGVRTTGIMEPGASLKVMQNVVIPYSDSGQSGFWTNTCGMKNRKATCRVPAYHVVVNQQGEATKKYRILTAEQSRKLEFGSAGSSAADESRPKQGRSSVNRYYVGVAEDGNVYKETSSTRSRAKLLMEKSSGRRMTEMLECSSGWYAEWVLEVMDTGNPKSVGVACNAKSKSQAISAALEACRRRGSNCLRASDSQLSSRVMVDAYDLDERDFDVEVDPSIVEFSTTYCHVLDGRVSGDCYLKDELMARGVYFE